MLRKLFLTAAVAGALVIPAAPSHATSCSAEDPAVDLVLCQVVWANVAPATCRALKVWCF